MTRLNVEPASPNIRPTDPSSSNTAARGANDLFTVFDTHLQRAQTPEANNTFGPNVPEFDGHSRRSAKSHLQQQVNERVGARRDDQRRDDIDEQDEYDVRHNDSNQLVDSDQESVATGDSSANDRQEHLNGSAVDDTQHDIDDASDETTAEQVIIGEAAPVANPAERSVHQGGLQGGGSNSQELAGDESSSDEAAGEGPGSVQTRNSHGNNILTSKDATTEDPVSIDEIASVAAETDAEADAETAQREDDGNNRLGRRASGANAQAGRDTPQSSANEPANTEASDTSDRNHDAETSRETAKPTSDVGSPQQGRPHRHNALRPNPQYGPEPLGVHEAPAGDAMSPAARSTLAAVADALTHDQNGQHSVTDSTSQAADEVAAAGGDMAGDARSRGNGQDARGELPPQLKAQFGSRSSGEAPRGDGLSSVQRARFVQRVGNAFRMANEKGGVIRLRLSPVELGSMRLEIAMRDGVMTARMEVESAQARAAIVENLGMLRQRLAEHNVEIERFDVEVRDHGTGETPEQNDHSTAFGNHRQNNNARGNNMNGDDTDADSQEPRTARRPNDDSQLNLVI